MLENFRNLLPYPRHLEPTVGNLVFNGRLTLKSSGLDYAQTQAFSSLLDQVFETGVLVSDGVSFDVRLDSRHEPAELAGVPESLREEAYTLTVDECGLLLEAAHFAGLQRGVMTVKQLIEDVQAGNGRLGGCRIVDWPRLAMRGIHYDLAREVEYRPGHMRRIVERLAYFKMNTLHLYLEGRFAFSSAPEVAAQGAMTAEDVRELTRYAGLFGIRLIPQIATLGHMNMLLHGPYAELRENAGSAFNLCPTHPGSRPFLAGMIRDVAEAFKPAYIHLGYDESHSGYCERCQQAGTPQDLLADHLNWLDAQVKSCGARSMIYGDMFLSRHDFPLTDAANGGTPEEACLALSRVSRDIIITDWHYTAPVGDTFGYLVEQGFEVHLASAVNTYWHDSIPFHRAHHWIAETTDRAVEQGISGAFNCNWELYRGIFFENNWFFQGLAAERQWSAHPHDYQTFSSRFSSRFWGVQSDYYAEIAGLLETIPTNRRVGFLDSGVMADIGTTQTRLDYESLADYLDQRVENFRQAVRRNADSLQMLDMPALIVRYLGSRMANLFKARLAFERGDRDQAIAAFGEIRAVALRVRERLEDGYRLYGGGGRDLERLALHLKEIDRFMKSGDPREWVTLRQYRVSALVPRNEGVSGAEFPATDLSFGGVMNVPLNEMADIRFAHGGSDGILYLRASVALPHAFPGKLLFGADGPVKVWVNGETVGVVPDATNPCLPDSYTFPVNWQKGNNDIVFALDTNSGNAWGVCARIAPAAE